MKEATGPDTVPKLVKIVNAWFHFLTSLEKTKSICEWFSRPGNCDNMTVPKINDQIYHSISKSSQIRPTLSETDFLCAMVPFIRMMEPYLDKSKPQSQPKESLLLASYSLQLVASALSSILTGEEISYDQC